MSQDADGTMKPFKGVVLAQSVTSSSVKSMSIDGVETSVQERTLSTMSAGPTDVFKWRCAWPAPHGHRTVSPVFPIAFPDRVPMGARPFMVSDHLVAALPLPTPTP